MTNYKVIVNDTEYLAQAKNPGSAARKIFKQLINNGILKRQPQSTLDGGWDNVIIVPENGWKPQK